MAVKDSFVTPVGRLVGGSLYNANKTDLEGKPLVTRTGPNAGQPRVEYYMALAIPKGNEQHWSQTEWGAKIWAVGHAAFPAQAQSPNFAWKISDGDSPTIDSRGKRMCDREGYPRHWILSIKGGYAPQIVNKDGSAYILDKDAVNPGDYIQVAVNVAGNDSPIKPGVLRPACVALAAYGERIVLGLDPKSLGFGQNVVMPAGASATPVGALAQPPAAPPAYNPPAAAAPAYIPPAASVAPMPAAPVAQPAQMPPAYPGILAPQAQAQPVPPPAPAAPPLPPMAPQRVMLPAAQGISYEDYVKAGWTDAQLVQTGRMQA